MRHATCAGALALVLLHAAPGSAQSSTRELAAEELFRTGRDLIKEHHYKEACEKLTASQKIDPAVGTLVSIGECYSGLGRTASAWLAYRSAIALATERSDPRRAAAEERAAAVEPQLSNLVVHLSADARAPAQIAIDGEPLGPDVLGAPVPIDPGPHTIAALAPGYATWTTHVQVGTLADNVSIDVPALELLPDPAVVEHARRAAATKRAVGIVAGSAGVVGLGVGVALGLEALAKIHDANRSCSSGPTCSDSAAVQENQTGRGLADASSVVIPVSAALIAGGAFLFFTSHAPRGTEVSADFTRGGGQVRVGWAW